MATRCRAPRCGSSIPDSHFYCRKDFEALEDGLFATIDRVYKDAAQLYIGRSHWPERRLLEHRVGERELDHMAVLHWAGCREEIGWLEERLIRDSLDRLKGDNISGDSEGGWSGWWNCVYVAWRWKARATPWTRVQFIDVEELDMGRRLVPDRSTLVKTPDYLRTRLSVRRAEKALDEIFEPA